MKKYKYHILITFSLIVVAVILFLKDKPGTLNVDTKIFAISDTTEITAIKMNDGYGSITLERFGSNWRVNNAFNTKPKVMKALLNLLMNLEISSPVSNSMKQAVLNSFKHKAVAISIESSGNILKAYQITENDSLKTGSFLMLKDDREPYLVHIPGYDGRISMLFSCDAQFWRDKSIFKYRPADILSIEINYPGNPKASFGYYFSGFNDLQIKSLAEKKSIKISKETARNFLLNFASVSFESQVKQRTKIIYDSLSVQMPFCEIQIKNINNQLNILRTYQIPVSGEVGKFNLSHMYTVLQNDTVPVIVKFIDFDPIMKEYNDFVTP